MPKRPHNYLDELLRIQAGSINTLFSYSSSTYKGSVLWPDRKIKEYLSQGLVRQIPFSVNPKDKRRYYLYQVSKKGASYLGRPEKYRHKDHQSYKAIDHELMKYDVSLAFIRLFSDYNIHIEYEKTLKTNETKGIRADIFIRATKKDGSKSYDFLVETEHKDDIVYTFKEKVVPYQKAINNGLFKINRLSDKTKVLFVCTHSHISTFLRPQEYKETKNVNPLALVYKQFGNLMSLLQNLDDKHFRFIPFQEFTHIHEPIWRMPSGVKVKIIE